MSNHKSLIWIDALEFDYYGGWKCDTQFTHLMGSGYLIACETPGEPVDDATTVFNIETEGIYRVWVRARNWYYSHSPGKFKIAIDNALLDTVLGEVPSNDWVWQIAGDCEMNAGNHNISLIDITGYFGRCSSIIITNDMEYVPPRPTDEFEQERARCKNISLEPLDEGIYDLIVAGAGPGGIPAAIAAARKNTKTLLISNRPVIGGNSSVECGVGFNGASSRQPHAREGGIVEEIIRTKGKYDCTWTEALERLCNLEKNLTIIYNMHICDAKVTDNKIESIITRHTLDGTRHRYKAKMFIDSTGDGWLGYYSGAKYRVGREAYWQHNEEFAPKNPDLLTMSGCLMNCKFEDIGKPVSYKAPDWVPVFNKGKKFGRNIEEIRQVWWNETPNTFDDLYDGEITRDELFRILIGYFNYLKNFWNEKEKANNYIFSHINYVNAKRESRRIIGDYILNQNDCVNKAEFSDVISHAGWPIDLHHPEGMYSGEKGPFFSNTHVPLVQIPYRCIYSVNIENLFTAGRNISVTHIALGTTRIQGTIGAAAQAAGVAASMCINKDITPRMLGVNYIKELQQQLIKDDQYIPGIKNEDKFDLAKSCRIEASSVSKTEKYVDYLGIEGELLPLDRQRATFFARGVSEHIKVLYLKLCNTTDQPIPITIHLREQKDPDGYVTESDTCVMTRTIEPNSEKWVEYPVDVYTKLRYLWIMVDPTHGISWRIWKYPPLDWTRSERLSPEDKFENIRGETHCLLLDKPKNYLANCNPENIINGYSRILSEQDYCWVSDKEKGLPQWISLTFPKPTNINEIHITFDTDMNNMAMLNPILATPLPLVTDYVISVFDKDGWHNIADVSGNYLRKHVYRFEKLKVQQIKVTVFDSGDHITARIFEIRAYHT